jgi:hypothetical protein
MQIVARSSSMRDGNGSSLPRASRSSYEIPPTPGSAAARAAGAVTLTISTLSSFTTGAITGCRAESTTSSLAPEWRQM